MSLLRPFEPNPFLVNAFTISDVPVTAVKPKDIRDLIEGQAQKSEQGEDIVIPAGGGRTYHVTVADLNSNEELLCDPNQRPREELLVPEEHLPRNIDGVAEFQTRHKLTPSAANAILWLEPLEATHLLTAGLPDVPPHRLVTAPPPPGVPKLARSRPAPVALLVKARDRRG